MHSIQSDRAGLLRPGSDFALYLRPLDTPRRRRGTRGPSLGGCFFFKLRSKRNCTEITLNATVVLSGAGSPLGAGGSKGFVFDFASLLRSGAISVDSFDPKVISVDSFDPSVQPPCGGHSGTDRFEEDFLDFGCR